MKNKKLSIVIIIAIIIIISLVIVGYLRSKKQGRSSETPGTIEVPQGSTPVPIPITGEGQISTTSSSVPYVPSPPITTPSTKLYQSLFNQSFVYLDLGYPLLYVYDIQNQVIKYLNLEDETYKEIVKVSDLKNAWFSEDKTKIMISTDKGFILADLKTDSIYDLAPFVKNFVFTPETWLYLNNGKQISYLAKFQNGEITKIRDLGILNPEFALLKSSMLIYEKNSPLFLLEFKNPLILKIFLEGEFFDVLANKNKDLIFLVLKENDVWQSKIIDLNKKTKYSFAWATNKEKCSFDEVLVCALPASFDPESWSMLKPSYDTKIVIYNPKDDKIKEINLEEKFDFVKPQLTPLGIIAWDRLSMKFYLLKLD
jgi:hypothetical protein